MEMGESRTTFELFIGCFGPCLLGLSNVKGSDFVHLCLSLLVWLYRFCSHVFVVFLELAKIGVNGQRLRSYKLHSRLAIRNMG